MENKIIPTAEEYAHIQYLKRREAVKPGQLYPEPPSTEQIKDMIDFAKLHVLAALKMASEKVVMYDANEDGHIVDEDGNFPDVYMIDRNSILNSYPLENIK